MTPPTPDDMVPDDVLRELQEAFAEPEPDVAEGIGAATGTFVDFDDPRLDEMLGIAPASTTVSQIESGPVGIVSPAGSGDEVALDEFPAEPSEVLADSAVAPDLTASTESSTPDPVAPARQPRLIVIGDDELPDAQYLDGDPVNRDGGIASRGAGDRDDSRDTIVIADIDDIDAVEPASVRTPRSMDPRVRARRVAVGRARGRRRLMIVASVIGLVVLLVGAFGVVASSLFSIDEVIVQGAVYTDAARLEAVRDDLLGEPILLADTRSAESTLEEIPWVERATVRTDFPHTVVIDIRERRPVATFIGSDQLWRVIDRDGRVLDVIAGQPTAPMLLDGAGPDAQPGQFAGASYASVARLVLALPDEVRALTEAASVDPATGDLGLRLEGGTVVRLGADSDIPGKLARLLNEVRGGISETATIDISTGEVSVTAK